jgi:hypothetical protein
LLFHDEDLILQVSLTNLIPAMKILKRIRRSFREFNDHCEIQKLGALHFLDLQDSLGMDPDHPREIDFFFYSGKKKNAWNLKSALENDGYNVEKIYQIKDNQYSICGTAIIYSLYEDEFLKWVEKMNEYAFINNCKFDGWGMIGRLES